MTYNKAKSRNTDCCRIFSGWIRFQIKHYWAQSKIDFSGNAKMFVSIRMFKRRAKVRTQLVMSLSITLTVHASGDAILSSFANTWDAHGGRHSKGGRGKERERSGVSVRERGGGEVFLFFYFLSMRVFVSVRHRGFLEGAWFSSALNFFVTKRSKN